MRYKYTVTDENGKPMTDENGKTLKHNDVSLGVFDILVEEVKDVLSSREMEVEQLNLLIQAGVPVPAKFLVNATNLKNKDEILQSIEQST